MIPKNVEELLGEMHALIGMNVENDDDREDMNETLMQLRAALTTPERYVRPHDEHESRSASLLEGLRLRRATTGQAPMDYLALAAENARAQAKAVEPVLECMGCRDPATGEHSEAITRRGVAICPDCENQSTLRVRWNGRET